MATTKNPVVHFEILGRDPDALRTFYGEALGWSPDPPDAVPGYSMVYFDQGVGGINGGIGQAPDSPGHATFYVHVDDIEAALATIERLGGRTIRPPAQLPSGLRIANFADPEGHIVGLLQ